MYCVPDPAAVEQLRANGAICLQPGIYVCQTGFEIALGLYRAAFNEEPSAFHVNRQDIHDAFAAVKGLGESTPTIASLINRDLWLLHGSHGVVVSDF